MSPQAAESLRRWLDFVGPDATEEQMDDAMARWQAGESPPVEKPRADD